MKKSAILLALLTSMSVSAEVELTSSDDNQLLINGETAVTAYKLYDKNNEVIPKTSVVMVEDGGYDATVSTILNSGTIVFSIRSNGDVEETEFLYDGEDCSIVGYDPYPDSFLDVDIGFSDDPPSIIRPSYAVEKESRRSYNIYEISNDSVQGYTSKSSCEEDVTDDYESGVVVTMNESITSDFNTYLDALEYPIYVKY